MAQLDIHELEWDHVNEAHMLAAHGVSRADVEELCFGDPTNLLVEDAHSGRHRVIAPRDDGKILVVILNPKGGGRFYPVTANQQRDKSYVATTIGRQADKRERETRI